MIHRLLPAAAAVICGAAGDWVESWGELENMQSPGEGDKSKNSDTCRQRGRVENGQNIADVFYG